MEADKDVVVKVEVVNTGLAEGGAVLADVDAGLAEGEAGLADDGAGLAEGGAGLKIDEAEDCAGVVEEVEPGLLPESFIGGTVMVEVTTVGPDDDGRVFTMTVPVDFEGAMKTITVYNFNARKKQSFYI